MPDDDAAESRKIAASTLRELARKNIDAMNSLSATVEAGPALSPAEARAFLDGQLRLGQATSAMITNLVGVSVNGLTVKVKDLEALIETARKTAARIDKANAAIRLLARLAEFSLAVAQGDVKGVVKGGRALADELGVGFG